MGVSTLPCEIYYAIMLITTAYQWCITTFAVSDKCVPEWLSISRSLQDWGLVYWEAACLHGVKSGVLCHAAARCSCARVVHWKVKVTSSLTDVWQQRFEHQDITVIVLCNIHFHPWLHENHTRAAAPGDTDWNRNARTCLSETSYRYVYEVNNGIWLKYGQQPAELYWSIDRSVTRLSLLHVSKPKANTLNICYDAFLCDM